jgi:hypothetical protein
MVNKTRNHRRDLYEYAQQLPVANCFSATQFSSHKQELREIFRFLFASGFKNIFLIFGQGEGGTKIMPPPARSPDRTPCDIFVCCWFKKEFFPSQILPLMI